MFHLLLLSALLGGLEAASPCTLPSPVFSYTQSGTVTYMAKGTFIILDRVYVEAANKQDVRIIYMDFANRTPKNSVGLDRDSSEAFVEKLPITVFEILNLKKTSIFFSCI
ncbi:hypothetical protein MAR_002770 [Mya arenaria]|uniref:Uncharacterized protein n=1 Tax=Mya arenaria TaxID=6604 RepID=A0ABY7G7A8_MYAAR|nr:hypothetical protein MAR_002770 [Mya arenaria]